MELQIKIPAGEFDIQLFNRIKEWLQLQANAEITISVKEKNKPDEDYVSVLNQSIEEMNSGAKEVFSMEELEQYLHTNFS